mmetsp:Transcript_25959/g.72462  ORF Transcript_25959/g.72462 Transcript_25959/m.72462 type:complete len:262 (-) Transcript_25959:543-1328(-)
MPSAQPDMQAVQVEKRVAMQHVALGAHDHPWLLPVQGVKQASFLPEHLHLVQGISAWAVATRDVHDEHEDPRAVSMSQDTTADLLILMRALLQAREVAEADLDAIAEFDHPNVRPCRAELLGADARVRPAQRSKQRRLPRVRQPDEGTIVQQPQLQLQTRPLARRPFPAVPLLERPRAQAADASFGHHVRVFRPQELESELRQIYAATLLRLEACVDPLAHDRAHRHLQAKILRVCPTVAVPSVPAVLRLDPLGDVQETLH